MEENPPLTPRAATESELRRRFRLRCETFAHGDVRLEILLPEAADELIDETEFEYDERLPYWADLWPSARALARHLLDTPDATPALELGAGVALPSLALRSRGVRVLATDYYDDALRFAEANAARNSLAPLPTALLDWRDLPPTLGRWPRAVAADVLYEKRNVAYLIEVLGRVVAADGTATIADPGRVYLPEFRDAAQSAGWSLREWSVEEEAPQAPRGRVRIHLLELSRR
jgi:predicted nicotinamide N-methyase